MKRSDAFSNSHLMVLRPLVDESVKTEQSKQTDAPSGAVGVYGSVNSDNEDPSPPDC